MSPPSSSSRRPVVVQMAPLFDKQPPFAIEAEMALLGSMILDWQVTLEVAAILDGARRLLQARARRDL